MYKQVFQNSKVALLFAGMTLFSAVSMVGTSEDSGVVTKAVDLVEAQRGSFASEAQAYAEEQSVGDAPPADPSVFGEYDAAAKPGSARPAAGSQQGGSPMDAPLSSTAIVVERGGTTVSGVPYISEREMTIEPE